MNNRNKRRRGEIAAMPPGNSGCAPPQESFQLPDAVILNEILRRLELESLLSVASVCRTLRSIVSQALPKLPSLDLSAFSPNRELLGHIVPRLSGAKTVTIDCLCLDDYSVINILGPHIEELNLRKGASLSSEVFASIGEKCPNLRILVLELAGDKCSENVRENLIIMLKRLDHLEHLSIKVRGTELDAFDFASIDRFLPKTLKLLKLQSVNEQDAVQFFEKLRDEKKKQRIPSYVRLSGFTLTRLSLILNLITDLLMISIGTSLPNLVELDLEDRPLTAPSFPRDLTNNGLQFLLRCRNLTHLSLVRNRAYCQVSFKRVSDLGLMLLSERCGLLESIKLGGFSVVTDAGFSSLLSMCDNLKKFDIRNAPLLSDLAFHNIVGAVCRLVELKLQSCNLVTSEAIAELASSNTLEVLDTYGCRSIADTCLNYVSRIGTLTSLNLGGADITDSGLSVLSSGELPLTNLCLRGCARVTERGIISLIYGGDRIKKTLISLDVGHMPGISDRAIRAIATSCEAITELCMRYCFHVTDAALASLACGRLGGTKFFQRLDICHCIGLSDVALDYLQAPLFRGLRWLGVGGTNLVRRADFDVICRQRMWLTVCLDGCELGCHDGWQFHQR